MATGVNRAACFAIPAAAALLLWPALWNGYPIVFADTGTYLSQAIHGYAGWDRPVFYSLFMLALHGTLTVWPVVMAQALLAAWVLWRVCRVLVADHSGVAFVSGMAALSVGTWLPWIVSELMPDVFTPLLVLVLCLLAWTPERLSRTERVMLVAMAAFMIASQQSSLPFACVLLAALAVGRLGRVFPEGTAGAWLAGSGSASSVAAWSGFFVPWRETGWLTSADTPRRWVGRLSSSTVNVGHRGRPVRVGGRGFNTASEPTRLPVMAGAEKATGRPLLARGGHYWISIIISPALAVLALCTVNLAAHGRFAVSPFGNVFLLARVIYDGPGMAVLRRDCPMAAWRLCPFVESFPPTSDDFLWSADSPLYLAGGPKAVSLDAGAIIWAAMVADPAAEARAALANTLEQLRRFASGDGLNAWPAQVSHWIEQDFPAREAASYAAARQQAGALSVPAWLAHVHTAVAIGGVIVCVILLPVALRRRAPCAGFLLAVLLALPVGAAITGGLSAPHDRYQARLMWLPPFIAVVSVLSLRRRAA